MSTLDRFVEAQRSMYDDVLSELREGRKRSHWMWFIFPQIAGLGQSPTARFYAIRDLEEAHTYLAHPLLADRLAACTDAMLAWAGQRAAVTVLGGIDAIKLSSSATLFEAAGGGARFGHCLDAFFDGDRDAATLRLIAR